MIRATFTQPARPQAAAGPVGRWPWCSRSCSSRARSCSPTPWAARSTTCSPSVYEYTDLEVSAKPTLEFQGFPVPRAAAGVGGRPGRAACRACSEAVGYVVGQRRAGARQGRQGPAQPDRHHARRELDRRRPGDEAARGRRAAGRRRGRHQRAGRQGRRVQGRRHRHRADPGREPHRSRSSASPGTPVAATRSAASSWSSGTSRAGPAAHARRDRPVEQHLRRGRRRRVGDGRAERTSSATLGDGLPRRDRRRVGEEERRAAEDGLQLHQLRAARLRRRWRCWSASS